MIKAIILKELWKCRWVIAAWLALFTFAYFQNDVFFQMQFKSMGVFSLFYIYMSLVFFSDRKDYHLLFSLPISRRSVIFSKFTAILLMLILLIGAFTFVFYSIKISIPDIASFDQLMSTHLRETIILVFLIHSLSVFVIVFGLVNLLRLLALTLGILGITAFINKISFLTVLKNYLLQPIPGIIIGMILIVLSYIYCDRMGL